MTTPSAEDREDILDQIARACALPGEFIPCRRGALSHHWQLVQPDREAGKGTQEIAMQCQRCLTIKRATVGLKYGELIGWPSYEYPEGYLSERPDGISPISPQAVRQVFATMISDADLPPMEPLG